MLRLVIINIVIKVARTVYDNDLVLCVIILLSLSFYNLGHTLISIGMYVLFPGWSLSRIFYFNTIKRCLHEYNIDGGVCSDVRTEDPISMVRSNGSVFCPLRQDSNVMFSGTTGSPPYDSLVVHRPLSTRSLHLLKAVPRPWEHTRDAAVITTKDARRCSMTVSGRGKVHTEVHSAFEQREDTAGSTQKLSRSAQDYVDITALLADGAYYDAFRACLTKLSGSIDGIELTTAHSNAASAALKLRMWNAARHHAGRAICNDPSHEASQAILEEVMRCTPEGYANDDWTGHEAHCASQRVMRKRLPAQAGDTVTIHGLNSTNGRTLNGCIGTILHFDTVSGRNATGLTFCGSGTHKR